MTKQAIGYVRVSTDKQADSGHGINAQLDALTAWAEENGYTLAAVYTDAGVSGAADPSEREGLTDALAAIGAGDVLLIAKRDRLSRDRSTMGLLEYMINKAGGRIVSAAGEGTDTEDPLSALIQTTVYDLLAQMERVQASVRTKAALAAKRRRGEYTGGGVPYGQQLASCGVMLEPAPAEQEVIAAVLEYRAAGLSYPKIAARLAGQGFTTRKGGKFAAMSVSRIYKGA